MDNHSSTNTERLITIPDDILDDLSSRFIINVPEEERADLIRVFFQIELAHWFYLDFYCTKNPQLSTCSMRDFGRIILNHIPSLRKYASSADSLMSKWRSYKMNVPTFGAILLNDTLDKVLLVQGYFGRSSWGFPKGKVNKEEDPHTCAAREVLEETGFDISDKIDKTQFIEHHFNDQLIRLYIVTGIPENANFHPRTRNEIKSVSWFPLCDLPSNKKDQHTKPLGFGPSAFFMVMPFIRKLNKWIAEHSSKGPLSSKNSNSSPESIDDEEKLGDRVKSSLEKSFQKQQQLFTQLAQNELSKYLQLKPKNRSAENHYVPFDNCNSPEKKPRTQVENKKIHTRPSYTPPPRFQKLLNKNPDFVRSKTFYPSPESKSSNQIKPNSEILITRRPLFPEDNVKPGAKLFRCSAWDRFQLDTAAMIACFNIHLRNPNLDV